MTRVLRFCVLLMFAITADATAQTAPASASEAAVLTELQAVHDAVRAAVRARDAAALQRLYADEFVIVHTTGSADTKAEHIARSLTADTSNVEEAAGGPAAVVSHVSALGNVAVVTREVTTPQNRLLWWTWVYVKRDGRWQILRQHGTAVPTQPARTTVDPAVSRAYVGRYRYDESGLLVTVSLDGATLHSQLEGRAIVTLVPESETTFQVQPGNAAMTFYRNDAGSVTHFIIRRGSGQVERATKIQ